MLRSSDLTTPRKSVTLLTTVLAVLATTNVARAGDAPTSAPAAAAAAPAAAPQASAEQNMAEARKQFQAGVNLLDDPDGAKYEEAHDAFRKAYELSQSPKVLGNIGFCAMHLERDGEAIDAYTAYLAGAPDVPERERAQIQRDLATLMSTMARVQIAVKRPASKLVLVDTRLQTRGASVENAYPFEGNEVTVRIRPGRHMLKVKADGEESQTVELTIEPASQVSRELVFAPPKPRFVTYSPARSPSVVGPVVVGIAGLMAIGGGVASGIMARNKTKDIESHCPNDICPADYDLDASRTSAKRFGTIADASLVGGGVLLAGAVLWYALLPRGETSAAVPAASRKSWRSTAMCSFDGCNLQLQRGF